MGVLINPIRGQKNNVGSKDAVSTTDEKPKKAWEIGLGGSALKLTRFNLIDLYKNEQGGYDINTQKKDVIFGGNISVARELNTHLYLDLQGSIGYTRDKLRDKTDNRLLLMGGVGLQWRLGEYFGSKYIDPYFRVGVNYMYKNFDVVYNGLAKVEEEEVKWELNNLYNKESADKRHLIPIAAGAGVNMWLNDRVGIGLQTDYLVMPYKDVANSLEATVRLMWRIGGKSKKAKPTIQYVEVEKRVEVPVQVVKEVVKEVEVVKEIAGMGDLFGNVHFDFDKATLTLQSEKVLDEIAELMNENHAKRYLIIGYTDARGSDIYNLDLSRRRAATVVEGLLKRGVPSNILKSRGVGKSMSMASSSESDKIREGDRKIVVEIVSNEEYWDYLPSR